VLAVSTATTGLAVLATGVLGGLGWFVREFDREESERRRLCQAYASVIAIQYHFIRDVLSDHELARWLTLAPRIARGFAPESFAERPKDAYPLLPDARSHLHLLAPATVDLLTRWHYMDNDMMTFWEALCTKRLSILGADRLRSHFGDMKRYRSEYRDYGYAALLALRAENVRGLSVDLTEFDVDREKDQLAESATGLTDEVQS
jgi:hypothetical protein